MTVRELLSSRMAVPRVKPTNHHAGSIIVTTPHTLAVKDAVKGINMFKKVNVPLLGLVQNMSLFTCPHCQHDTAVFGSNEKVKGICQEHSIELIGDIPLHQNVGDDGQRGKPTVVSEPESDRAQAFMKIAQQVGAKIGLQSSEAESHSAVSE